MIIIDAFLRFSGIGLLLFASVLTLRDLRRSASSWYLLLACLSTASHFLGFTPTVFDLPYGIRTALRFLDIFQLIFIWLFALSLFQKGFKFTFFHLLVCLFYSIPVFMERLIQFGFIHTLPSWWAVLINATSLLIVAHMLMITIKGRGDDLIESRRRSRIYLVFIIAFSSVSMIVFSFVFLFNGDGYFQPTANVLSIWPAIIWVSYWLFCINKNKFSFDDNKAISRNAQCSRDLALQKKLDLEVLEKQCFLENNISIESLAKRLGVSSYRLRAFINQTLGYNNFSSYINAFRIDAIKTALLNPENNHIPILTIALNNGFYSLPPFNRAFKSIEGMTPSQFRKKIRQ